MRSLAIFALLVLIWGCDDDPGACDSSDPVNALPWLKTETQELNKQHHSLVRRAKYKDQTVFLFQICCTSCLPVISIKDCQGKFLGTLNTHIKADDISDEVTIWQADNFECLN